MGEPAKKLFDTLSYAKELEAAGFTQKQAEVQAKTFLSIVETHLVTTYDLRELEVNLEQRIKELEVELKRDIKEVDTKATTNAELLRRDIKIWFGSLMLAGLGGLATLITILSHL